VQKILNQEGIESAIALHPCTRESETGAITRLQPLLVTLTLGFLLASALE